MKLDFKMGRYFVIAFLVNILFNLGSLNTATALSLNSRSKRNLFPQSLHSQNLKVDSDIEDNNQISSKNPRNLRQDTPPAYRIIGADDEQYVDDPLKDGSEETSLKAKLTEEYKDWKTRNTNLFKALNEEADIPLRRITFTSKYLWDQKKEKVKSYAGLKKICKKYKLEMVEITNEADFGTLANFLVGDPSITVGLGTNDNKKEGKFVESDEKTKIQFQMFFNGQPDNDKGHENCITLSMSPENEIGMSDTSCDSMNVNIICQRKTDSVGYEDSVESIGKETEGLDIAGDADGRRYYIGRTQKPWEEAKRSCEDEKKQLLDLGKNETSNQALYRMIIMWRAQKGLHSPTGFWTSGQYADSLKGDTFKWRSSGTDFNVSDKSFQYDWAPTEPADQSKSRLEKCIDFMLPPKINDEIKPQFRVSNCELPFYFVCYETLYDDPTCRENKLFKMTGAHSKYLYSETSNPVSRDAAKELCEKWDYEIADIQSLPDILHLSNFVQEKGYKERVWHVGITDKDREGEFYEGDLKTRISFQAFALPEPNNFGGNEDCVILSLENGRLVMNDMSCSESMAEVICQFPKKSSCYINSQQNLRKPREGLIYFGETAIRRYFLSRTQKTWIEAMEFCSSRNKKLLDILFIGELSHFKNQLLLPMLIQWAKKFFAGIWTSGRFAKTTQDGQFNWETTGGTFMTDDKSISFSWAPGEPSDSTSRNMELCVELVVSTWANNNPGDELLPVLKASNCLIPNYFVCYEDAPHLKNCHLPPNVDFSFKTLTDTSRYIYLNTSQKLMASERKDLCHYWGLDVADISSIRDYKLVSSSLDAWNATQMYFGLGLNSVGTEGLWFEGDGFTPIKFQAFGDLQPKYYSKDEEPMDYVNFNKFNSSAWQMTPFPSSKFSNVLCQFRKDSNCAFQDIFNYMERKGSKNFLKLLKNEKGEVPNQLVKYYVGDSQQTWEEAMRFCWSRNKNLLDLSKNTTEVQGIYQLLAIYLKKIKLHPTIARFWTSGKYVQNFNDGEFRWESIYQFVSNKVAEAQLGVTIEPPPTSTADNDRCLTIGLESIHPKKKSYKANLRVSNCYLPYYIICYENFRHPPLRKETTTTPEPIVKYKDVPPCKEPTDPKKKKLQAAMEVFLKELRPPGFLECN